MTARSLWYNAQGAPRAPWRLAIFFIVFSAASLVFSQLAAAVFDLGATSATLPFGQFVYAWSLLLALFVAHAVCLTWVDRQPWTTIGLGPDDARPGSLALGTMLGALAVGVPGILLLAVGWLDVVPGSAGSWWMTAFLLAMLFLPAALAEELLFRGYPFAVLRSVAGPAFAIVATSVLFAVVHVPNQAAMSDTGALWQGIGAVFLAGIFLGGIVVVTGSVYAAWAAHFAWNFVLGGIMHSPVSGISVPVADYQLVDGGPDWATGGGWGPEGGAGAALGMLAAMAILFTMSRRARRAETTTAASGDVTV